MQQQNEGRLTHSEWGVVFLLFTLFAVFILHGYFPVERDQNIYYKDEQSSQSQPTVSVTGQVAVSGDYPISSKDRVKDLIQRAGLLPNGDLSDIKMNGRLVHGDHIHVPEKRWIEIEVSGAVLHPGPFSILSGTTLDELLDQLDLSAEADLTRLKKRGAYLRSGDQVVIPSRSVKKRRGTLKPNLPPEPRLEFRAQVGLEI